MSLHRFRPRMRIRGFRSIRSLISLAICGIVFGIIFAMTLPLIWREAGVSTETIKGWILTFWIVVIVIIAAVGIAIVVVLKSRKKTQTQTQSQTDKVEQPYEKSEVKVEEKKVYCIYCGEEISSKAKYCEHCGKKQG
jgi:predicted histidine transporter YuiF (NhaC family)